jgi:hypothetical protein
MSVSLSSDDPRKNRNARRRQRYRERQREAQDSTGHDSQDSKDNPRTDKPKPDSKENPQSSNRAPKSPEKPKNTADVKPHSPRSSPRLTASKTEKEAQPKKPVTAPNVMGKVSSASVKEVTPPREEKRNQDKPMNGPVAVVTKPEDVSFVPNGDVSAPPLINGDSHSEQSPDSPKDSNMNKLTCKLDSLETEHQEAPLPQRKQRERSRNEKMINGNENIVNGEEDDLENHVEN